MTDNFNGLDPKSLALEIGKKVQEKSLKNGDVVDLLHKVKAEMPEDYTSALNESLKELMEDVQELKEALKHHRGTDDGVSSSGVSLLHRLNIFHRFVQILKEGGPHAIIALLIISNVYVAKELKVANERIINLLIALQLSPSHDDSPNYAATSLGDGLPPEIQRSVMQSLNTYRDQMPARPYLMDKLEKGGL